MARHRGEFIFVAMPVDTRAHREGMGVSEDSPDSEGIAIREAERVGQYEVFGGYMTILTIDEAARFLRLTKRTLYQRLDIPRVRYGHRVMFIEEDLERWVRAQREVAVEAVDASELNGYHRNPLFSLERS